MNDKTKALLEAALVWPSSPPIGPVLAAIRDWHAAGCPDLDAPEPDRLTPAEGLDALDRLLSDPRLAELEERFNTHTTEPDRLAELEARLGTLAAKMVEVLDGGDERAFRLHDLEKRVAAMERSAGQHDEIAERVDAVYNWVQILNEQHALHGGELSDLRTSTASGLMRLTDRIKALEPKPTPPPEPARFVPTEPGWYWYQGDGYAPYPRLYDDSVPQPSVGWLAPVAPYAPPTRTEEEARREPRRGDRWQTAYGRTYTVLGPAPGRQYSIRHDSGLLTSWPLNLIGERNEKFLGNFAHELEAP